MSEMCVLRLNDTDELLDITEQGCFVFSSLEKAQAYAQRYSDQLLTGQVSEVPILEWHQSPDLESFWIAEAEAIEYVICRVKVDPEITEEEHDDES